MISLFIKGRTFSGGTLSVAELMISVLVLTGAWQLPLQSGRMKLRAGFSLSLTDSSHKNTPAGWPKTPSCAQG